MKNTLHKFFCVFFLVMLAAVSIHAADENASSSNLFDENADLSDGDMTISADRMQMNYGKSIDLEGNVIISDLAKILTSDRMIVELDENNQAKKIEAIGSVCIRQIATGDSATGDRGVYDVSTKQIVLDGNCTIIHETENGKHIMNSPQVIYNTETKVFFTQADANSKSRPTITLPAKTKNKSKSDLPANKKSDSKK